MAGVGIKLMKPDAIIFDYGNVIVGPLDRSAFDASLTALAAAHGFPTGRALWEHIYISDDWEQAKRGHLTHQEFWERRLAALDIHTETGRRAFKARLYEHWGIIPGMRNLLIDLRPHYRLAILSNSSRRNFAAYITERRGLGGLFEAIISSAEEGVAKPEPAFYLLALERLKIRPEQALFIDDQVRNTAAAEALGIESIVFTAPQTLRRELEERGIL